MSLYFITGNKGKFAEVLSMIPYVVMLDLDLTEIQELDAHKIIKAKLAEAMKTHSGECIIEDTSLYFEAMNGLPGPLIKWFAEALGNEGLVHMLENFENKRVEAKTIIGYADIHGEVHFFEGSVKGSIVAPRGKGFGWDPIFQPDGFEKTFGEMTIDEKNTFSMRKRAVEKLKTYIRQQPL